MENYLSYLLEDISFATCNAAFPQTGESIDIWDWISPEEEDRTARVRDLEEWTGIRKEQLPPPDMLTDDQIQILLQALDKMLAAYNVHFVLQTTVPERIQYATIRDNFDQCVKVRTWHMGFFELCKPGTEHGKCPLGDDCQCKWYAELFAGFEEDNRSPEEIRRDELDMEIRHLKRKYGDDWMKYYPYHMDPDYDDENEDEWP